MRKKPNIIVSSVDAKRLETLLDSLSSNSFPGMAELEAELERAEIVAPEDLPATVVTMNSTVKFRVEPSGEEFVMTLVYPGSEDSQGQKISIMAPVGSALLGLTQGDEIEWPRPGGGVMRVSIVDVIYQPERSGDFRM